MKKILAGLLFLGSMLGSTYALSCAGYPSFDELYEESQIAFVGTVTDVSFVAQTDEDQYCQDMNSDLTPGEYTYTFDVEMNYKDESVQTGVKLTRGVTGINCTRGGACNEMEVGMTYVVLTDGQLLQGGLCSPCPYLPIEEFVLPEPEGEGSGEVEMCICTMEYAPVCGVNGQNYSNKCAADCENIEIAYQGECQFGEPGGCERGYSGEVCGTDGVTYKDLCDIEAEGVERAYDGTCVENPNPMGFVDVPSFCTSRYDGCNNCMVENAQLTSCTERACIHQERPRCNTFEFSVLLPRHEKIINTVVGNRSTTATAESREQILQKVTSKIDSINSLLARSTFVQGSKELRSYQLALEVLWMVDSLL